MAKKLPFYFHKAEAEFYCNKCDKARGLCRFCSCCVECCECGPSICDTCHKFKQDVQRHDMIADLGRCECWPCEYCLKRINPDDGQFGENNKFYCSDKCEKEGSK